MIENFFYFYTYIQLIYVGPLTYPEMGQYVNVEDPFNFVSRVIEERMARHYTSIVN